MKILEKENTMIKFKETPINVTMSLIFVDNDVRFTIECEYQDNEIHNPDAKVYSGGREFITFVFDSVINIGDIIGGKCQVYKSELLSAFKYARETLMGTPGSSAGKLSVSFEGCTLVMVNNNPVAITMDGVKGIILTSSEQYFYDLDDTLDVLADEADNDFY